MSALPARGRRPPHPDTYPGTGRCATTVAYGLDGDGVLAPALGIRHDPTVCSPPGLAGAAPDGVWRLEAKGPRGWYVVGGGLALMLSRLDRRPGWVQATVGGVGQFANAFSVEPGCCFRWIYEETTSRPMRCPGRVRTRGWWQDGARYWWLVDACHEHAEHLSPTRPPGARVGSPLRIARSRRVESRRRLRGPSGLAACRGSVVPGLGLYLKRGRALGRAENLGPVRLSRRAWVRGAGVSAPAFVGSLRSRAAGLGGPGFGLIPGSIVASPAISLSPLEKCW
jgi:hypothetical protein